MRSFLIALVLACVPCAQTTIWGGDHLEMQITAEGARLEFDCAAGTIDERVSPDAQGAFKVKGTFTPETHGPVRDDAAPRTVKATYAGTIKDEVMSLRLEIEGEEGPGRTFSLVRDQPGNVRKCR
ncbi:MAG TPA: hypothetical protein VF921_03215 [Vicinamibacterales bacterium]